MCQLATIFKDSAILVLLLFKPFSLSSTAHMRYRQPLYVVPTTIRSFLSIKRLIFLNINYDHDLDTVLKELSSAHFHTLWSTTNKIRGRE